MGHGWCNPCGAVYFLRDWIMFKKIGKSVKELPINGYVVAVIAVLYCINRFYLKQHTAGIFHYILVCHFNDFLCGGLFVAYINIILYTRKALLTKMWQSVVICFLAGLIWEFWAPYVRADSVTDWLDILSYVLGGIMYWSILKAYINSRNASKSVEWIEYYNS